MRSRVFTRCIVVVALLLGPASAQAALNDEIRYTYVPYTLTFLSDDEDRSTPQRSFHESKERRPGPRCVGARAFCWRESDIAS